MCVCLRFCYQFVSRICHQAIWWFGSVEPHLRIKRKLKNIHRNWLWYKKSALVFIVLSFHFFSAHSYVITFKFVVSSCVSCFSLCHSSVSPLCTVTVRTEEGEEWYHISLSFVRFHAQNIAVQNDEMCEISWRIRIVCSMSQYESMGSHWNLSCTWTCIHLRGRFMLCWDLPDEYM